ncbi:MAG: N-acetyltransferase family protein [Rhodovibrionaceae bacterium]
MSQARHSSPSSPPVSLRPAAAEDFHAIAEIYGHFVLHGLASFEEVAPDAAELRRRWLALTEKDYPYLVAVQGAHVLGYAYAGPYRPRPAYRFTVENSVYVAPDNGRHGLGGRLLDALIAACEAAEFRQMIAIIGDSANAASIGLHRSRGFVEVGTFKDVGFKHGRWVDSVLMQRALGGGGQTLPQNL